MAFRPSSFLLLFCGSLMLAGCSSLVGEERAYYFQRDWERLKGPAWQDAADDVKTETILPTATQKERMNEEKICGHPNSQDRVMTQNGVSDSYSYRRCPLAPYDTAGGTRMGIRPDGNGTVVK